tara:strand:- start:205 stop:1059 length:855 start_codon:yes stop_codon:yes gene_type:complete
MAIRSKLTGGLGNQMFQFAAAFTVAKRKQVDLFLDLGWLDTRNLHNGFELENVFDIYSKVNFLKKDFIFKNINIGRYLAKFDFKLKTFEEPHFHFSSEIFNISNHVYLKGYWQSELYFREYSNELKKIFIFSKNINESISSIKNEIYNSNSVSIHIRRGDYVSKKNINHYIDLKNFYLKAAKNVARQTTNPIFFIFSDDPGWVSKNFKLEYPYKIVNINNGINSFKDMYLMSLCKHNIIANSSFSWWAAWLNNNEHKMVFAPKNWFKDKSINTENLYPISWITV